MFKRTKAKLKELWHVDSMIDLLVDGFLLLFDVITSPILIIVRLIRHFFNNWIRNTIAGSIKWIVHKIWG